MKAPIASLMAPFQDAGMQVTRRDLVAGLAALQLTAATPQDKLQKAYADVQEIGLKLRQISVPTELEPAFVFEP